jgi:alpha-beta hydrolase superfamily lysophospholipase
MQPEVYFAHGQEGTPDGLKIQRLRAIAERLGFRAHSPDYRHLDDPDARAEHLLQLCKRGEHKLVLAGSSAGAYVSAAASERLRPDGLFLLAPALGIPGFGRPDVKPRAHHIELVHAWEDEVVAVDYVLQYARQHKLKLHLLSGDHRLYEAMPEIEILFESFLKKIK